MTTSMTRRAGGLAVLLLGAGGWLAPCPALAAPPTLPDACALLTVAEVTQVAGPLDGRPRKGDVAAGEASCEYTRALNGRWINISLAEGDLDYWRRRNGGPKPVMLPEFGKGAFVNLDADGSVDLFAAKGKRVVRVSMPTGPEALGIVKALTRKALARP